MSGLDDIQIEQGSRLIGVKSFHLGPKKIVVTAFEGTEALSVLPHFRLEIASLGRALKPSEMLGQTLAVTLRKDGQERDFHGIVGRFQALQTSLRDFHLHVVDLVPPTWLLTLNQRCRIFLDKKATDAVGQVLQEAGITSRLKSAGAMRDYIVQYCESDFDFVSRLLEDEGLFYYFAHGVQNCPFVVGNGLGDYVKSPSGDLQFYADEIESWQADYAVGGSSFKHADWDFKAVNVLAGNAKGLAKLQPSGVADRPLYEFPGRYATADAGRDLARLRMEEEEAAAVRITGGCANIALQAAAKFKIKDHKVELPQSGATTDNYLITSVTHQARDGSGLPFETETSYSNGFTCIPAELNFRPPRVTPRPSIRGPQLAIVTDGPDEFGRAKVKFPWEESQSSFWARVAQSWAYNQMGTQFLPRIDSEVVVEFLDGDPDHPLIVGMLHNGKSKLLYDLPANKTRSGIRGANWDDKGVPDKSNELRFEDKAGQEEIYLHAQKDFRRVVVNDDDLTVERGNRTVEITTGNVKETVAKGNVTLTVKTGNIEETLDMGNLTTKLKMGNQTVKLDLGAAKHEAMQSIELKVGQSSVKLDQAGVTIKGMTVKIEGAIMVDLKSPMTNVKGDGMLTLKGGITMIN